MKDELGGKIVTKFFTLRAKTYSYLTDDCREKKAQKAHKKCDKTRTWLEANLLENEINYLQNSNGDVEKLKENYKYNYNFTINYLRYKMRYRMWVHVLLNNLVSFA